MYTFLNPYTFANGATVRNRIMLAPMTNFASAENGEVTDEELAYYRERSRGAGTVVTAVANVTPGGKGFPGEIGIDRDELVGSLSKLATTIQAEGAKAIVQIFHAGRMAPPDLLPDRQTVSASAVAPEREGATTPRELTEAEIEEIIKAFGDATRRAIQAGFDGVEIHGANTYLIQQFFSPHSNRRDDQWGGSVEKRMRFPLAVVREVLKAAEEADEQFIIGYRISPEEREEPGITMEDTLKFVNELANEELDYLHISVQDFFAGSMRDSSDKRSRVQLIQDEVGAKIPVVGVGSLQTPDDVEQAMEGGVPLIALGRELVVEPQWVEKAASGRIDEIRTELSVDDREQLVVPESLWNAIVNRPGWFPVKEHAEN
ncbi:NADH-dependent flavin oxidoreductase [Salisediminibacterium halotolerans]|uniref:NADH-dependent flavin oxidoreductase n=1 Tax=Salisediminibacterium halotolerans TaxID=517425 RepID=UPI000EAB53D8|nr:NADH-dependent flavin oxidoreductase [Salisediminibacterium halotolerans]RLJ75505.1 2,4-dienoyl-CoA reductase-like NADH-dependent reductase (Old Yellow Enzyme family) [Actinophytocola xinjiangensis]RPE89358.1 2,4-dienoyl-CoA reductase-like NADH-dependent reductase (Old Yellow Enzyme family) [Salisediminibacterium halotolerans]TWG36118.1 2,4-dienoyl-CoA reductase-like NADH-dependent reductase (Old Yellow Enzyme family) [Salisediminibacterium halotolerans]GEL08120.1 putative NADH-dependent fla